MPLEYFAELMGALATFLNAVAIVCLLVITSKQRKRIEENERMIAELLSDRLGKPIEDFYYPTKTINRRDN